MARAFGVIALALLWPPPSAYAEPSFARLFRDRYGYQPACNACHTSGGGSPLNAYGEALKEDGVSAARFAAVEKLDSDGDGAENLAEIRAKANPGDRTSTPRSAGDWLDPANLIPAEVQAAFPGVRTYKPIDTLLTANEVERAHGLGVALGAKDENTIFLPLDGQRPLGAAIIIPAELQGKIFFLLVAVDRTLAVLRVVPTSTINLPAAKSFPRYGAFAGWHVKDFPTTADPASLDGAITAAVKKALTLLYVRLKKE